MFDFERFPVNVSRKFWCYLYLNGSDLSFEWLSTKARLTLELNKKSVISVSKHIISAQVLSSHIF